MIAIDLHRSLAWAAIAAGVVGTALLYWFSDSQSAPQGLGSAPEMWARAARRLRWVRLGFALLMLSFALQGVSLLIER